MTDPRRWLDDGSEASPALRTLLASARRSDEPGAPRLEALAARLAPLMGPPPGTPGAPPGTPGAPPGTPGAPSGTPGAPSGAAAASAGGAALAVKLVVALVALGAIGGGAWYLHGSRGSAPDRDPTPSAAIVAPTASSTAPAPAAPPRIEPEPVAPIAAPVARPDQAARAPAHGADAANRRRDPDDGEAEGKLVVDAEAALVRDDAAAALGLTRSHAARFPTGAHAEERDRIAVEALVRLGNRAQASAAAERFFTRYPHSIYRARLEGLVR
jgi:hypothetical protein